MKDKIFSEIGLTIIATFLVQFYVQGCFLDADLSAATKIIAAFVSALIYLGASIITIFGLRDLKEERKDTGLGGLESIGTAFGVHTIVGVIGSGLIFATLQEFSIAATFLAALSGFGVQFLGASFLFLRHPKN